MAYNCYPGTSRLHQGSVGGLCARESSLYPRSRPYGDHVARPLHRKSALMYTDIVAVIAILTVLGLCIGLIGFIINDDDEETS